MFACDVALPAVASPTSRLNVTDCDETGFPHSFCEWLVALHLEQKLYDYHMLFSSKAAVLLREKRTKVDWSKRDRDIISLI
jgi:hypothetical protein